MLDSLQVWLPESNVHKTWHNNAIYSPQMPIGKVWIYRLLFVCFFVCVCSVADFCAKIKLAASNFVWWFIGILGRDSVLPYWGTLLLRSPKSDESASTHRNVPIHVSPLHWRQARGARPGTWVPACGRGIGMSGYTAVPEDGRTCSFIVCLLYIITTRSSVISGNDESIVMSRPAHEGMETTTTEDESETETVCISHSSEEQPGQTQKSTGESWFDVLILWPT